MRVKMEISLSAEEVEKMISEQLEKIFESVGEVKLLVGQELRGHYTSEHYATVFKGVTCEVQNKKSVLPDEHVPLLQYNNLRKHFSQLINDVLGSEYYNEGMDVYSCDEYSCRDLKLKLKLKRK